MFFPYYRDFFVGTTSSVVENLKNFKREYSANMKRLVDAENIEDLSNELLVLNLQYEVYLSCILEKNFEQITENWIQFQKERIGLH